MERERMGKGREDGVSSPRRRDTGDLHGDGGAPGGAWLRRWFGESESEVVTREGGVGEKSGREHERFGFGDVVGG